MAQVETKAVLPERTDVRFSMRAMLTVMAVTAVMATALGAFIRLFPAESQWLLWIYWGFLLLLVFVIVAASARFRYQAERKAGRVLFLLVPHTYFLPCAPRVASTLVGASYVASVLAMWVAGSFIVVLPARSEWMTACIWIYRRCSAAEWGFRTCGGIGTSGSLRTASSFDTSSSSGGGVFAGIGTRVIPMSSSWNSCSALESLQSSELTSANEWRRS